jgi:hypothetical protein
LKSPTPKTVLLVSDNFGPIRKQKDLENDQEALALSLTAQGYQVTVLIVGKDEQSLYGKYQKEYKLKGITVEL